MPHSFARLSLALRAASGYIRGMMFAPTTRNRESQSSACRGSTRIPWTSPLLLAAVGLGFPALHAQTGDTPANPNPEPIRFHVLESRKIRQGGRSIIMNRVAPPVLPAPRAAILPMPVAPLTDAQKQALAIREAKKSVVLFLSVTVYDRQVSELRWLDGPGAIRIFSNIDFNHFAGVGGFKTADASYTLMLGLGNESREQVDARRREAAQRGIPAAAQRQIPARSEFSPTRSEYMVEEDPAHPLSDEATAALDALHVYYDANKQRLTTEYAEREAANAARLQQLKDNPPKPKDTIINYWRKPNELPQPEPVK